MALESLPCTAPVRIIYVSGPMSGLPEFNFPAFIAAEAHLKLLGYTVESPHHNAGGDTTKDWVYYMRLALIQLMRCSEVYMLPGWEASRGAVIEHDLALKLGFKISYAPNRQEPKW